MKISPIEDQSVLNKEERPLTHQLSLTQITMDAYHKLWRDKKDDLNWDCLFVLPFWLDTVCRCLGSRGEPAIFTVSDGTDLIGVVPLALQDNAACFLGDPDVCDYQDIVSAPGKAEQVMQAVITHLSGIGIRQLDLRTLRPDAAALEAIENLSSRGDQTVQRTEEDVTYEVQLPDSWEDFLSQLNSKQRHEVRRKTRRLDSQPDVCFQMAPVDGSVDESAERFIQLFQMNRTDKAEFMNQRMAVYFRELIQSLAQQEMLRLYFLYLGDQPAATALCFDYNETRYLYNSGYDTQFQALSVGILSKVFTIRKGIEAGCRSYDFLKGAEVYKKRTGGQQVSLYRCKVAL